MVWILTLNRDVALTVKRMKTERRRYTAKRKKYKRTLCENEGMQKWRKRQMKKQKSQKLLGDENKYGDNETDKQKRELMRFIERRDRKIERRKDSNVRKRGKGKKSEK